MLPFEGEGRRVVFVDLHSGERLETEVARSMAVGDWAPGARELAFIASDARSELSLANLETRTIRPLGPAGPGSKIAGWHGTDIVVLEPGAERQVVRLVPTTGDGRARTLELPTPQAPVVSASVVAWIETDGTRGERQWSMKLRGWDPTAEPVSADLGRWSDAKVTGFGVLDDDHVYAELESPERRRLFIVRRDGTEAASADDGLGAHGHRLHSLVGPPEGPWIATGAFGTTARLSAEGKVETRAQNGNLGSRAEPWIPTRAVPGGVMFFHRGELDVITRDAR